MAHKKKKSIAFGLLDCYISKWKLEESASSKKLLCVCGDSSESFYILHIGCVPTSGSIWNVILSLKHVQVSMQTFSPISNTCMKNMQEEVRGGIDEVQRIQKLGNIPKQQVYNNMQGETVLLTR